MKYLNWYYGFLGCISEPRRVEDIGKIWGVTHSNITHYFPIDLLRKRLTDLEKIENRRRYYRTIFDGYLELLKKVYPKEKYPKDLEIEPIYLAEKDDRKWVDFWNNSEAFRKFCTPERIELGWKVRNTFNPIRSKLLLIPLKITVYMITIYQQISTLKEVAEKLELDENALLSIFTFFVRPTEFEKELIEYTIKNYKKFSQDFEKFGIKETALWKEMEKRMHKETKKVFSDLMKLLELEKEK